MFALYVFVRLKFEFEDRVSGASEMDDESQDWFVNDKRDDDRAPSPTKSENANGAKDADGPASVGKSAGAATASGPAQRPGLTSKKSSRLALATKKSNTAETAEEVQSSSKLVCGDEKPISKLS